MLENRLVQEWLNQFIGPDKLLAQTLLNSLTLVSSTDVANGLSKQIHDISKESFGKNALIPIRKIQKSKYRDENKEYRKQYSSADMLGYTLMELERQDSKSFIVEPTVDSMRSEKIKNIILVDDIIGTGNRVVDFWKQLDKSIKSWISYKKCKIWLVTYAAHESGIDNIVNTVSPFTKANILNQLVVDEKSKLNNNLQNLCYKYAQYTSKSKAALGYGQNQNRIIFEFSCPNNSPAILWANGKEWKALFPNRSIPAELKYFFDTDTKMKQVGLIFDVKQQKLALLLLDAIDKHKIKDEDFYILTLLSFIQKGYGYKKIQKLILLSNYKVNELLNKCVSNKLMDTSGFINKKYKLTKWGKDLLNRFQEGNLKKSVFNENIKEISIYYPRQFKNVPAKI